MNSTNPTGGAYAPSLDEPCLFWDAPDIHPCAVHKDISGSLHQVLSRHTERFAAIRAIRVFAVVPAECHRSRQAQHGRSLV